MILLNLREKKILSYEAWAEGGDTPCIVSPAEQARVGGGRQQWLGAGQPSSGTLQLTWLRPALPGPFCCLTLPNLV